MKYQGKSMMSLNQMAEIGIKWKNDGYVTGYPIVSDKDAYILNGVVEANEEYIAIEQWIPVFPESLQPASPSLTDDQQVVLDYLKNFYSDVYEDCSPLETMYLFGGRRAWSEESNLTDKEELQVLAAFASWGLNSCQNGNS